MGGMYEKCTLANGKLMEFRLSDEVRGEDMMSVLLGPSRGTRREHSPDPAGHELDNPAEPPSAWSMLVLTEECIDVDPERNLYQTVKRRKQVAQKVVYITDLAV